ncbi:MAG: hexose kinase [Clostridia bacterium]|nr:hexose kinase [Clostridia bacterium]
MKIVTLTLNPAFDVHCFADNFKPYHETIAQITSIQAGGKGVNVSRALTTNGVENTAVIIVGTENGPEFCKALEKDGLTVMPVWADGRIRENITLHESDKPETRISFTGFTCTDDILDSIRNCVGAIDHNTIITFTGSISGGMNVQPVLAMLSDFKAQGAKVVIDSRSVSLRELIEFKPWLIKPNKDEIEYYTNQFVNSVEDAAKIAAALFDKGIENVMISLGGDGAVLVCAQGAFYADVPDISVVSTIGAGDSTIAGFIDATQKSYDIENALRRAIAYGTTACTREGTLPPLPATIHSLEKQIKISKL